MSANLKSIREKGLGVLSKQLGATDSVRFIRQFEDGNGDYTEERTHLNCDVTVDDIAKSIYAKKNM